MDELTKLVPSVRLPSGPTDPILRVHSAVVQGTLRYFNHHDSKWVLGFDACSLFTPDGTTESKDGLTLVLLRRGGAQRTHRLGVDFRYGCVQGPEGTSPYVLTPATGEAPPSNAGTGFYTECRSKQRRFRIEANDAFVILGGVALNLKTLYIEASYL